MEIILAFAVACIIAGSVGFGYLLGENTAMRQLQRIELSGTLNLAASHAVAGSLQLTNGNGLRIGLDPGAIVLGPRKKN